MKQIPASSSVILFDGYCNFCSGTVNFILKHDKKKHFLFATSQSDAGKEMAANFKIEDVNSVILIRNQKVYRYSTAVMLILQKTDFPVNMLSAFIIIPALIRDAFYKLIAKKRYDWFGKRETCRVPSEEEKKQFLN